MPNKEHAESGLVWGFEIESLVLGILEDGEKIEEKVVLDLSMNKCKFLNFGEMNPL